MNTSNIKKLILNQYIYYVLIGVVSFLCLCSLPFVGSQIAGGLVLPVDTAGWIVFIVTKVIGAIVNMLIFSLFIQQARLNIRDDPKYLEALEIAGKSKKKEHKPSSPTKFFAWQYGFKGTTVFAMTIMSACAMTQAILMFDWVTLLTYVFTLVMGIVFGVIEMKKVELYWTTEYYDYVKMMEEQEDANQERQDVSELGRAGT